MLKQEGLLELRKKVENGEFDKLSEEELKSLINYIPTRTVDLDGEFWINRKGVLVSPEEMTTNHLYNSMNILVNGYTENELMKSRLFIKMATIYSMKTLRREK